MLRLNARILLMTCSCIKLKHIAINAIPSNKYTAQMMNCTSTSPPAVPSALLFFNLKICRYIHNRCIEQRFDIILQIKFLALHGNVGLFVFTWTYFIAGNNITETNATQRYEAEITTRQHFPTIFPSNKNYRSEQDITMGNHKQQQHQQQQHKITQH